jgi:bis(5'-nucleosyl)-tetraphosphatase (symmetrical)
MATTYAIGDVQGCYDGLIKLLACINFDFKQDSLWFCGDLVNRGPNSLETLLFIKSLKAQAKIVLGNHDMHLIACYYNTHFCKPSDTLESILKHPQAEELIEWLCQQPLCHWDQNLGFAMTHAGFPPIWSLKQTITLSKEVEDVLKSPTKRLTLINQIYGNQPDCWNFKLSGIDRLRCIINYLTRMRFINADSKLELTSKESIDKTPEGYLPWFQYPNPATNEAQLIFGHWAALKGITHQAKIHALDTGYVWGESLTALCLETGQRHILLHPNQEML